ncbi:MAG: UDP-N-acetylmuramate dehydrogenase [Lachnospiraceae bacterium]|nr:UDP-N-acetylmuramate dehydrogenase [Lachnospiraceae bacterium]
MDAKFLQKLEEIIPKDKILINEPLSKHTGFRTGGAADYFVTVEDIDSIKKIITLAISEKITYYIIGNGSNLLVSDNGFRGMMIRLKTEPELEFTDCGDDTVKVTAGAGCSLSKLANECAARGLKGLEFAAGIPGTVGGAVVMNAGAYGGEIKDCILCATIMDRIGNTCVMQKDQLHLGYRTSIFQDMTGIVLDATFIVPKGNADESRQLIAELAAKRREKQPLEYPSVGSTFKRPTGNFAGKLIEEAGLKGFSIGDAEVSEKHAGFIINKGKATSADIYSLIFEVQRRVYGHSGVKLEPEVKLLGF